MSLRTSTRNRLPGTVMRVRHGEVMSQIDIRVGDNHLVSVITREAAEELALQEGDQVLAMVKATEVTVGKETEEDAGG